MKTAFADPVQMQHRLFAELSRMFGQEVPLYDKSLQVNRVCNQTVSALLARKHAGFAITDAQLDQTSGERHGAIRIGKPAEYRLICRFFAAFGMAPHNFYDMTNVGAKSQPIIATAFRSKLKPEHRVFCSLLMTDYFDPKTRARIEALLASRQVFSLRAIGLLERNERQGGLDWPDATALIREGVDRIFKWTGEARDYQLYQDLCAAGFKIAADIACFGSHHLNHLTPNTFCIDLYTAAMKFCLRELDAAGFRQRAETMLGRLARHADRDYLKLHFRHLTHEAIAAFRCAELPADAVPRLAEQLIASLQAPELALNRFSHSGFKDFTEGPPEDTPILLRQDAYKALTEPVRFHQPGGAAVDAVHTARFGEIEQRFYATTPKGRVLYDRCLAQADALREKDPTLIKKDFAAYEAAYARPFAPFPKTLPVLLAQGLVYGRYAVTTKGLEAAKTGGIKTTVLAELIRLGFVDYKGLRYEDFLPVSAAGIFASNLNQYGTQSTAAQKPVYTQGMLEEILGCKIVDPNVTYGGLEAASLLEVYSRLGVLGQLPATRKTELEQAVGAFRASSAERCG